MTTSRFDSDLPDSDLAYSDLLQRIGVAADVMGGQPVVAGSRLPVAQVLAWLAAGESVDSLVQAVPRLQADDVRACLAYAARLVQRHGVPPAQLPAVTLAPQD